MEKKYVNYFETTFPVKSNPLKERFIVVSLDTMKALFTDHANTEFLLNNWFLTER